MPPGKVMPFIKCDGTPFQAMRLSLSLQSCPLLWHLPAAAPYSPLLPNPDTNPLSFRFALKKKRKSATIAADRRKHPALPFVCVLSQDI